MYLIYNFIFTYKLIYFSNTCFRRPYK